MDLLITKLWVLLVLTVCRLVSGLCPLLISKKFKRKIGLSPVRKIRVEKWVGYSMDFSGGLLLATCFLHMIPEVREHLMEALKDEYKFPYAETLVCAGFFIVFVIEESVRHIAMHKTPTHQPLNKTAATSALMPTKGCEMSPAAAVDRNGATNGVLDGEGMASSVLDVKFVAAAEMDPMMVAAKEELALGECNNNAKRRRVHTLKNILLVSALSFHSVMEGLAIGLALDVEDVWYLFFAVTTHECTILLCVGIELVTSCPSALAVVFYMTFYALVSPAGVLFGTLLTLSMAEVSSSPIHLIVISSLQGLAAGTILYVTFFEVLNNNKHHHDHHHQGKTHQSKSSIPALLFILLGFLFMVLLELMGGHEHVHSLEVENQSHSHRHLSNISSH